MSDVLLARLAERDRLDALIAADVAEFDAAQLWDLDAATSMVAWLRDKARMSVREAQRLVTLAKRLRVLPVTGEAWARGELSSGQVQEILQGAGSKVSLFAEHEAEIVPRSLRCRCSTRSRQCATGGRRPMPPTAANPVTKSSRPA